MGSQNAIVGDSFGIDLPETSVDTTSINVEKSMARFSKTKEFKRLKEMMDARIEFYQKALPDGRPLTAVDAQERASQWVIANAVIGEFKMILEAYEGAAEVLKNERS